MKYSIITVNYNNREGLRKTIESVIHQTFHDFEYIIIDGGSSDGSAEVLKEYDKDITYWVSEPDKGIYNAMNKGIAKATGDYLNFMNSGDCFYDNRVLEKINKLHIKEDMIVGRDYHYNALSNQGFASILPQRISMLTFYVQTLPHQSTFFRKELFNNCPYDESLKIVADLKFYIQNLCVDGCSIRLVDDIICSREPDGVSKTYNDRRIAEHQAVIHQFLPAGAIKDYQSLALLDMTSLYRLIKLIEGEKSRKWLTYIIKFMNRCFK